MKDIFKREQSKSIEDYIEECYSDYRICGGQPSDTKHNGTILLLARIIREMEVSTTLESRNLYGVLLQLDYLFQAGNKEDPEYDITDVLDFLDFDVRKNKDDIWDKEEEVLLGKIRYMKMQWLPERERTYAPTISIQDMVHRYTPQVIKDYLDDYVISQESVKKAVSVAVYNHLKRINNPRAGITKRVVLLIGPSGCGKTEIMRRIRELIRVPFVFTDVSGLGPSQFGNVRKKEDLLINLYNNANEDLEKAQQGIIFMDEFDKLLTPSINSSGEDTHDTLQGQLLKMIEGCVMELKINDKVISMDTSNILFIMAGAFEGIEDCVKKKRLGASRESIGFLATFPDEDAFDINEDNIDYSVLIDYGMKPELAGRINTIAVLERLKKQDMIRILTEPKDSIIARYQREMYLKDEIELEFEEDALEAIIEKVYGLKTGARAIISCIRSSLQQCMYEAPGMKGISKVIITRETVLDGKRPKYIFDQLKKSVEGVEDYEGRI